MNLYVILISIAILNISNVKSLTTTATPVATRDLPMCSPPNLTPEQCSRIRFAFMCNVDSDCKKDGEKCCNNGCVGACEIPQPVEVTSQNVTCPPPSLTSDQCLYVKFPSCDSDANCGEDKKCCNNGCGTACVIPQCTKSGSCSSENVNCIWSQCNNDCDCPGAKKCCHGCLCTDPE